MTHYLRRPGRWLRRTCWMAGHMAADLGLRGAASNYPIWLRDNPFLVKTSRVEMRRFSLGTRLLAAVTILSGLLLGGLWLQRAHPLPLRIALFYLLNVPAPTALFVALSFVHALLIGNVRTALSVSLGDEARRGTLPDLLMSPLRRAEMLLAMGIGPARTAFLVALAGLPLYVLLAEFGGLSFREIALLYVLFALISYAPPSYVVPPADSAAPLPSFWTHRQRTAGGRPLSGLWLWLILSVLFVSQGLMAFGGGWLGHLLATLGITLGPIGRLMIFLAWPYLLVQILSQPLNIFHLPVPPLVYILPLAALNWAAGALNSAAALSAEDAQQLRKSPLHSRAQTLARWVARAAALIALGIIWKPWVESGDTALLAGGSPGMDGWDAAGLALLLGSLTLPLVCNRALAVNKPPRLPLRALRHAARHALRPLGVASMFFLIGCALGGLSPFAPPVYQIAGKIALACLSTLLWAVGIARVLPAKDTLASRLLLYALPIVAIALPLPLLRNLAAFSPAAAWIRLFPEGPALIQHFPLWPLGLLPPFSVCIAGSSVLGLLLMAFGSRITARVSPPTPNTGGVRRAQSRALMARNAPQTAALMGWITAHTDNPLFTYEMRTRTRSGRWADWRFIVPGGLGAAIILTLVYPAFIIGLSAVVPFHFFGTLFAAASLAALLLAGQVYAIGFRGQTVGESLIIRDRQRGIWGFILLTPLASRQIFWGKVFGQTFGFAAVWAALGVCSFVLYALAVPAVGLGPACAAWLTGQVFVATLFLLGVSLGAALATMPIFLKSLHGASTLLFVGLVGGGIYINIHVFEFSQPETWQLMVLRLTLGSAYALALTVPLFAFAEWRMRCLLQKDIAFGDGAE